MSFLKWFKQTICIHDETREVVCQAVYDTGRSFNCAVQIFCKNCDKYLDTKFEWREECAWEKYYGDTWPAFKAKIDSGDIYSEGSVSYPHQGSVTSPHEGMVDSNEEI